MYFLLFKLLSALKVSQDHLSSPEHYLFQCHRNEVKKTQGCLFLIPFNMKLPRMMSNYGIVYIHHAVLGSIPQKASEQPRGGKGLTVQTKYLQPCGLANWLLPLFVTDLWFVLYPFLL